MEKLYTFQLRGQQQVVFQKLKLFVENNNMRVFILRGYAGTGKTTLMREFVKWIDSQNLSGILLASTGRAAKILSDKTGKPAHTVHSKIYSFAGLDDDIETMVKNKENLAVDDKGQISLVFDLKPVHTGFERIYIVDEASMISDTPDKGSSFAKFGSGELLKDLFEYDPKGKFVFVGDACQLPPIGQPTSPALTKEYIEKKYRKAVMMYELTEIIRQDSLNGIVRASMKIRKLQAENPQIKWASFPLRGEKDILIMGSHANLVNEYIKTLKAKGTKNVSIICQTNRQCSELNTLVRGSLGRKNNLLEKDDVLLITQNNYISGLANGDLVTVLQVGKREMRAGLSFLNVEVEELESKGRFTILMIEDILYSNITNLNDQQHKELMFDFFFRMKYKGIDQKDRAFLDNMFTDPYLNALRAVYGYALTCHKGQGGEWDDVFLYIDKSIHGIPKPGIYQWVYTAITRAKQKLFVVDDWYIK